MHNTEARKEFLTACKYLLFFILGGTIYYFIEIMFRGYSHISMFILGGICYILIGFINEYFPWEMYLEVQVLIGTLTVLILEFLTGLIVNVWLGWGIWDYSNMPLNIMGQICVPFALLWMPLVLIAIVLDDCCRHFLGEDYPNYRSWIITKATSIKK